MTHDSCRTGAACLAYMIPTPSLCCRPSTGGWQNCSTDDAPPPPPPPGLSPRPHTTPTPTLPAAALPPPRAPLVPCITAPCLPAAALPSGCPGTAPCCALVAACCLALPLPPTCPAAAALPCCRLAAVPCCCLAAVPCCCLAPHSPHFQAELHGAPSMPAHLCICSHVLSLCPPLPPSPRLMHAAQPWLHPSHSLAKLFPPCPAGVSRQLAAAQPSLPLL